MQNVIIIGGGPAGLSAGIYLARAGLKPLIFAGSPPGGQLTLTSEVENYPGHESILGAELIEKMRNQAIKFGALIKDENVTSVEFNNSDKLVNSLKTKSVLIATGAKALWLGVPGEERLRGKGVSACATCDAFFFRGKNVAIVGGGDTALEEALTLAKFAKNVIIIHRKQEFRASKIMQERVKKHPQIHLLLNAVIDEIIGEQKVVGLEVKIKPSDGRLLSQSKAELGAIVPELLQMKIQRVEGEFIIGKISIDGIFVAIGHKPDTELFKGKVELDEKGYILTSQTVAYRNFLQELSIINNQSIDNGNSLKTVKLKMENFKYQTSTSISGVFAAGDCVDSFYRQAATAAGMGVGASLDVEKWLDAS